MEKVYLVGSDASARAKAEFGKTGRVYVWLWAVTLALMSLYLWFESDWKAAVVSAAFSLAVTGLFWMAWRVVRPLLQRNVERRYASFRLVVDHDGITRDQAGLPQVRILFSEISLLEEFPGSGLLIRTSDPYRRISVPAELIGYEELKAFLSQWRSPARGSWRKVGAVGGALGATYAIAWGIIRSSHDARIVLIVALLLTVYMLWSLYKLWRTPEISSRGKLLFLALEIVGLIEIYRRVAPYLA